MLGPSYVSLHHVGVPARVSVREEVQLTRPVKRSGLWTMNLDGYGIVALPVLVNLVKGSTVAQYRQKEC